MSVFTEPAFLALLFLLGGILIGHVLWYRYQREFDEINHEYKKLLNKQKNFDVTIRNEKAAFASLQDDYSRNQSEWDGLKSSNTSLANALRSLQSETEGYDDTVARLERLRQTAEADLDAEREDRQQLEETVRRLKAAMAKLKSTANESAGWQSEKDRLESANNRLQVERDELLAAVDGAQGRLTELQVGKLGILQQSRDEIQAAYDTECRKRSAMEAAITDLEEKIAEMTAENRQVMSRMVDVELLNELQAELDETRRKAAEMQTANHQVISRMVEADVVTELQTELDEARRKTAEMQTANHQAMSRMVEAEVASELQADLVMARQTIAELQSEVGNYEGRLGIMQQEFDGTVMSAEQRASELSNARSEIRRQEAMMAEIRDSLQERSEALDRIKFEKETLHEALEDERERRAALESSIEENAAQSRMLFAEKETALSTLGRHERSIADMQSMVDEYRATVEEAQEDKQRAIEELMAEREARTRLEGTLRETHDSVERVQSNAHTVFKEKDALLETVKDQSERLASLTSQHEETVTSLCRSERTIAELTSRLTTLESSETELRNERQDLFARLQQERDQRKLLESTLNRSEEMMMQIQQDSESLKSLQLEYTGIQSSLQESMSRMKHLVVERDEATEMADRSRQTIRELRETLDELQMRASERDRALATAEEAEQTVAELRATVAELGDVMAERDQAMNAAATADDNISELQALVADLKARTDEAEQTAGRLAELEDAVSDLDKVMGERDTALNVLDEANTTIETLRQEIEELRARLEDFERSNSDLMEKLEVAEREPQIIKFEAAEDETGPTRYDSQYGMLYNEAPDPIDDLKVISGIAFVYEERLNDLGVYTYAQIMNWNDNNIYEFGELLDAAYNDRIRRDDWVGQARKLHYDKYGKTSKKAA